MTWGRPILSVLCAGLLVGCGSASTPHAESSASHASAAAVTSWASQTQQLCAEKRAAIARLGYVNITYAGIARVGLPAVRRLLDGYLGRLLAVLSDFSRRQQTVPTPASLRSQISLASKLDRQSQTATNRLRREVARVQTAAALSVAFHAWTVTLRDLALRGDAVARQLNLPACRSGVTPAST